MREAMRHFVRALHRAYLDAAAMLPTAERGHLPLVAAERLTVVAVGAGHLHVLGTTHRLAAPEGMEVVVSDALPHLTWNLRFFDPVVVPQLVMIDESGGPRVHDVRRVLGIADVVYHLTVEPGSSLTEHHAQHAGTALAHQHAAAFRDHEEIRARSGRRVVEADELAVADRVGLRVAVGLLAERIAPDDSDLAAVCRTPTSSTEEIRRALLLSLRRREPRTARA